MPNLGTAGSVYGQCVLGGYTYAYNPDVVSKSPVVRAISETVTLNGVLYTDWGYIRQDRVIDQTWTHMEIPVYQSLYAIFVAGGTQSFVDEWGETFTVLVAALDYANWVTGGQLVSGVQLKLRVVN